METATRPTRFVTRVREEMAAQKLSVRGLARRMDPVNIDRARRNLHRWLDEGISPGRASRREVATALGLDTAELDDDEEADHVAVLMNALRRFVRAEVSTQATDERSLV
jgi:hypothetical protein